MLYIVYIYIYISYIIYIYIYIYIYIHNSIINVWALTWPCFSCRQAGWFIQTIM